MTPADLDLLGKVALGVAGGAVTVGGWLFHRVVKEHDDKIAALTKSIEDKVDQDDHDRQRDHVVEIFKRLGSIDVSNAEIRAQMSRFASDIESEKRERADVSRELNAKLDRLLDRILPRTQR